MLEEKLRSIGEVARLSGVPVKTIRYYSDEGLLPPAEVTGSRYRLYGATEIWRLQLIRTLRDLGFGLGEVRRILSGELPAGRAISWQREAIADRIRHLERLEAVLERAESGASDPERSLDHLHAIGEALAVETEDRGRFLADKLLSAVMGEDAPEDWRKEFIRSVSPKLPAEMSPEQEAAWVELVGLIGRGDFVAETREQTAPLWGALRERGIDASWWHERITDIGERARKAVENGATPGSAEVQEIVADWVAHFARASGEPVTPDFVRRFAEMAPRWAQDADATTRRIKALFSQLDVEHEVSQEEVEQLIVEGLEWMVERES